MVLARRQRYVASVRTLTRNWFTSTYAIYVTLDMLGRSKASRTPPLRARAELHDIVSFPTSTTLRLRLRLRFRFANSTVVEYRLRLVHRRKFVRDTQPLGWSAVKKGGVQAYCGCTRVYAMLSTGGHPIREQRESNVERLPAIEVADNREGASTRVLCNVHVS